MLLSSFPGGTLRGMRIVTYHLIEYLMGMRIATYHIIECLMGMRIWNVAILIPLGHSIR
jgi:uncharacterized protein (DUF433 family)